MRNNISSIAIALFTIFSIAISSGCGGKDYSLAPVSGTVTYEGKPVEKLRISFSPVPIGENLAVGPFSKGVTDSEGKFTLKTRYDEEGAVVGAHKISFQYTDISETAMSELAVALMDAQDVGDKEEFKKTKKKIAEMEKKLNGRPVLGACDKCFDIPAGGLGDLQMDLGDLIKKEK